MHWPAEDLDVADLPTDLLGGHPSTAGRRGCERPGASITHATCSAIVGPGKRTTAERLARTLLTAAMD